MDELRCDAPPANREPVGPGVSLHDRYDWLDQSRGVIVVFLAVSMITYPLSGSVLTGEPIVGPTFLNHGSKYLDGIPQLITFVDIGQQIFMFLMGFVAYIAFSSRLRKRGRASAWLYAMRRVSLLYLLSFVDDGLLQVAFGKAINWYYVLWHGTFANLAIGAFAGYAAMYVIRNANRRILLGILMLIFHALLYRSGLFARWGTFDDHLALPRFPFDALNHASVAIIATCFSEWLMRYRDDLAAGMRTVVLPGATAALVSCYCVDWLQPAEPHDVTTSHALLAIAVAAYMIGIFYSFGHVGFRIPLLSKMGKNLLLMFVLGFIFVDLYVGLFSKDFLVAYPLLTLILVGLTPLVMLSAVAYWLDKKGIVFRV